MSDVEYMQELDSVSNMRAITAKLPYKQRERWRSKACALLEKEQRSAKFRDLVGFVIQQAEEALHPLFGDITDGIKSHVRAHKTEKSARTSDAQRSFTTAGTAVKNPAETKLKPKGESLCAFSTPCLFCQGEQHTLEHCKRMKRSLHKEKIDFLKSKGLCFSCLKQGHMSKACDEKMACQVCLLTHPDSSP